jgi:hypothetical protein
VDGVTDFIYHMDELIREYVAQGFWEAVKAVSCGVDVVSDVAGTAATYIDARVDLSFCNCKYLLEKEDIA